MNSNESDGWPDLAVYYLYDIFECHPPAYKRNMSFADFTKNLDDFRERMNDANDCRFTMPSQATIRQMYKAYEKGLAERSGT